MRHTQHRMDNHALPPSRRVQQAGDDVASFLPRVLVLCQDTDSCVREAAAHGLAPLVAALLGSGHSSGNSCVACASGIADVLEELKELLGDEVTEVRVRGCSGGRECERWADAAWTHVLAP